jgi:hypothetical protein
MLDITIQKNAVNIEALDADLRTALGEVVSGLSLSHEGVTVHLIDKATPMHIDQARSIVLAHDPTVLTPAQQAALLRRQKLEQSRREQAASELDQTPYIGKDPLLIALAGKIAWLEREIADLRSNS